MQVQYFTQSGKMYREEIKSDKNAQAVQTELSEKIVSQSRISVVTNVGTVFLDTSDIERVRVVD